MSNICPVCQKAFKSKTLTTVRDRDTGKVGYPMYIHGRKVFNVLNPTRKKRADAYCIDKSRENKPKEN